MKPTWSKNGVDLYLGDCREILPQLPKESVRMIWTDPPYGHGNMDGDLQAARVRDGVKGARKADIEPILNDAGKDFDDVLTTFFNEAARVLRQDSCCCCCCCCGGGGPKPTFARIASWMDSYLSFFHAVVWDKSARGNGLGWRFRRNYEFVMIAHRKGGRLAWADEKIAVPNVMRDAPVRARVHPNEKPISLIERFIALHTAPSDVVLDPFMGSGTTGAACVNLDRGFIGIEADPRYFEIAVNRIETAMTNPALVDSAGYKNQLELAQ